MTNKPATTKTQSVCKTCLKEVPADQLYDHLAKGCEAPYPEPVAEPASTGEPSPALCAGCREVLPVGHAEIYQPSTGKRYHARCEYLAARPSEPSAPQTSAEQYIGSDQERVFLEKKALGDFAASQPVSGDAPKVEEIARQLSQKFGFHSSRVLTYEGALGFLRPYFPPASQTPEIQAAKNELLERFASVFDSVSMCEMATEIRSEIVATPASTARTDALLNLLRAADDVLAEQSLINQRFTQKQDALFAELMGWRDANGILAAPGSVPQTPNNHSDLFFGNLQYSLQTLFAKVGNPFKDLAEWGAVWEALESARKHFGVPQAEPPKEEKPWITGKL